MITPTTLRRVIVIGSCLAGGFPEIIKQVSPGCGADFMLVNHVADLPPLPPCSPEAYDFQVVQVAMATILPEGAYLGLAYDRPEDYAQLFDDTRERLSQVLAGMLRWNREHGILTFVFNFLVPQQNLMGRLMPRYDLRNFVYFIERLNEALASEIAVLQNVHIVDLDQIVATFGRRNFNDDVLWVTSHGAALTDWDHPLDQSRLEALAPASSCYPTQVGDIVLAATRELIALYRTISQIDTVKLVLIDLDDTLWRGVIAEADEIPEMARAGWPTGFAEALRTLQRRGILLGIVSKNEQTSTLRVLETLYGDVLPLDVFAVTKINWLPKADNIEDILETLNLLPRNVIFIDDNPVERASVKAAFPDMRVLGANPYLLRRILLWAPETQFATLTAESTVRTTMVQQQLHRESQRKKLTREEFLATLRVSATLRRIGDVAASQFSRAFELINKTNQFNTTGRRWTHQECVALFAAGGGFYTLDVTDRFTAYGLVGVVIVNGSRILQFVMSCRVLGMEAEKAAIAAVLSRNPAITRADFLETAANLPCRDLWDRCGFIRDELGFTRSGAEPLAVPAHVTLEISPAPNGALA